MLSVSLGDGRAEGMGCVGASVGASVSVSVSVGVSVDWVTFPGRLLCRSASVAASQLDQLPWVSRPTL
jgi:hypothetical protein